MRIRALSSESRYTILEPKGEFSSVVSMRENIRVTRDFDFRAKLIQTVLKPLRIQLLGLAEVWTGKCHNLVSVRALQRQIKSTTKTTRKYARHTVHRGSTASASVYECTSMLVDLYNRNATAPRRETLATSQLQRRGARNAVSTHVCPASSCVWAKH